MLKGFLCLACALVTSFVGSLAFGDPTYIYASQDTYINSSEDNKNSNFNNDGTLLRAGEKASSRWRTIAQFDLSGVTDEILTAHIEFYQLPTEVGYGDNSEAASHKAWILPGTAEGIAGMDDSVITYALFDTTYNPFLIATDSLGDLSLPEDSTDNFYHSSAIASQNDIDVLNARRTMTNPAERFAFFFFEPESGLRLYGDREGTSHGQDSPHAIRLVITTVPEPASMALMGIAVLSMGGMSYARRRIAR
jgi:hypothetical protein